jgi:hypothetical protein
MGAGAGPSPAKAALYGMLVAKTQPRLPPSFLLRKVLVSPVVLRSAEVAAAPRKEIS